MSAIDTHSIDQALAAREADVHKTTTPLRQRDEATGKSSTLRQVANAPARKSSRKASKPAKPAKTGREAKAKAEAQTAKANKAAAAAKANAEVPGSPNEKANGPYTVEVKCEWVMRNGQACGRTRFVKPQDRHQVHTCKAHAPLAKAARIKARRQAKGC